MNLFTKSFIIGAAIGSVVTLVSHADTYQPSKWSVMEHTCNVEQPGTAEHLACHDFYAEYHATPADQRTLAQEDAMEELIAREMAIVYAEHPDA